MHVLLAGRDGVNLRSALSPELLPHDLSGNEEVLLPRQANINWLETENRFGRRRGNRVLVSRSYGMPLGRGQAICVRPV